MKKMECTGVSYNMLKLVQDYFCTDAYLTTGNISDGNIHFFECTLDYLKNLTFESNFKQKLKVHVWITLSSGEIIDFTFFRSMAANFPRWQPFKSKICMSPFIEKLGLMYKPMIIGEDFYIKTGNMYNIKISN